MTLEGPAPHPLVPPFEEFIFQNLAVSFGSSFSISYPEKSCRDGLKMNSQNLLPKFTKQHLLHYITDAMTLYNEALRMTSLLGVRSNSTRSAPLPDVCAGWFSSHTMGFTVWMRIQHQGPHL